ncbi:MAG TPA: AMP-binding protein [Acidimicrobiales bacterium]|nr:AMP-binding protein [Acidimicrobiales bacterium]
MKELVYPRMLLPALERFASKQAFHNSGYAATYAEHGERVLRLAHAMRHELGLGPGDRYAVMAANGHEFLELYHAGFLGAGVINPLNLRLAGRDLQFILADSETEVVFVDSVFAEHLERSIAAVRDELQVRHVVLMGGGDEGLPHDLSYEQLLAAAEPEVPREPEEDQPVVLMYTGGTTGLPKGVLLDQRAEMLNLYHIAGSLGLHERRVFVHQTPMFHAASMGAVLGIPATGGTSVFVPLFEPEQVMDAIERFSADWTVMVPTMIAMVLDHPGFRPERLATLSDLVYGASPMPQALLARLAGTLPETRLWQGYGMTECSSVLTFLSPDDHRAGGARLRSAGRPVMGVTVCVQDGRGRLLSVGAEGEICARGGNFMRGYWHRPQETEEAFRDGWYHSGDAGHVDAEGYVYLTDRINDMIVSGGENVYSIEVENAVASHPAVAEVAVIGIPHPTWGEQVHAIVVLHPGATASAEEIREHARSTLARYKVPKSVEFRSEPLPLSGALKPLKRELRRPYWEKVATPA